MHIGPRARFAQRCPLWGLNSMPPFAVCCRIRRAGESDDLSAVGVSRLLVVMAFAAGPTLPFGLPPEKADPMLAKVAPEECVAYISWSGSAAADAANGNQTEQLLAAPEVQLLLDIIDQRLTASILELAADSGPNADFYADDGVKWGKKLLTRPTAIFLSKFDIAVDRRGQAIGTSTKNGEYAVDRPVHFQEVFATLYHNMGIDPASTAIQDPNGRTQYLVYYRRPIEELV